MAESPFLNTPPHERGGTGPLLWIQASTPTAQALGNTPAGRPRVLRGCSVATTVDLDRITGRT